MARKERNRSLPIEEGRCNECGAPVPPDRFYCDARCSATYSNRLAAQGKALMQMLKVWRKHRGAKGTPGEGKMSDVCDRLDAILAEDRARWDVKEKEK